MMKHIILGAVMMHIQGIYVYCTKLVQQHLCSHWFPTHTRNNDDQEVSPAIRINTVKGEARYI